MKSILSYLAVIVLLSACGGARDYPSSHKYYSANNNSVVKNNEISSYEEDNDETEVCVGQWCGCGTDIEDN